MWFCQLHAGYQQFEECWFHSIAPIPSSYFEYVAPSHWQWWRNPPGSYIEFIISYLGPPYALINFIKARWSCLKLWSFIIPHFVLWFQYYSIRLLPNSRLSYHFRLQHLEQWLILSLGTCSSFVDFTFILV